VKKLVLLATAALLAMLILVPAAMAQGSDSDVVTETTTEIVQESTQPLPKSGGVPVGSILLPASALLVGGGILGYAVLQRR
jgi:hypothetical protein